MQRGDDMALNRRIEKLETAIDRATVDGDMVRIRIVCPGLGYRLPPTHGSESLPGGGEGPPEILVPRNAWGLRQRASG